MVRIKLAGAFTALALTLGITAGGIIWDSVGTPSTTASGVIWDSAGQYGGSVTTDDGAHPTSHSPSHL